MAPGGWQSVARVIGSDDPADPPALEAVAKLVYERKAFPRRRMKNQGLGCLAKDVSFLTQRLQVALVAAQLSADVGESSFEITATGTAQHGPKPLQRPTGRARSIAAF
jgi:hypothetical protein